MQLITLVVNRQMEKLLFFRIKVFSPQHLDSTIPLKCKTSLMNLHNIYDSRKLGQGMEHTFKRKKLKNSHLSIYNRKYQQHFARLNNAHHAC